MKLRVIVGLVLAFTAFASALAEPNIQRVVGLVELPSILGTADPDGPPGMIPPAQIQPVPLHSHPTGKSPVVAMISSPDAVETKEFDYEARAAVVYEMADDWVLVRMMVDSSSYELGWIHPNWRGPFHPVEDLFKSGLCYLTTDWDGFLYVDAGNSKVVSKTKPNGQTRDIDILEMRKLRDRLWVVVELLGPGRCEGIEPEIVAKGWLPVHKRDGKLNVWFFSRGC